MTKKKFTNRGEIDKAREELEGLEDLPLVGGLFKGLGKFVDLVEKVEEAGGEIKREGKIKGLGKDTKGVYGFSIRSGLSGQSRVQSFGNIRPVKKKTGEKEVRVAETREPIVDVFDEKDHILIIAELPGIDEKSIKLELKGDILILEAGGQERKYAKEILLPAGVDFQARQVEFKNGILKVKLKKISNK